MGRWEVYVFLKLMGMGRPEGRRLIFLMGMGWWEVYVFLELMGMGKTEGHRFFFLPAG